MGAELARRRAVCVEMQHTTREALSPTYNGGWKGAKVARRRPYLQVGQATEAGRDLEDKQSGICRWRWRRRAEALGLVWRSTPVATAQDRHRRDGEAHPSPTFIIERLGLEDTSRHHLVQPSNHLYLSFISVTTYLINKNHHLNYH